jgi:putative transposase
MARPLRLSFENAFYHITARGIRKDKIFYSDKDKEVFVDKMNETFEKYSFVCYAYCLMDNHYHLFIKTPLANISQGMHYLNTSYANWFRAKHKLTGSIFQGRYKSILVDADSYVLVLSAYIHLNPLRAGMVENINNYPFSSFLDYIGKRKPAIKRLDMSLILNKFSDKTVQAQKLYKEFVVNNSNIQSPIKEAFRGIALGSDNFIEKIKEKIKSLGEDREIKETRNMKAFNSDEIVKAITDCFNIKKDELFKKQRGNIHRQLALYLIKKHTAMPLKEIGELFNMDYTTVSVSAKRFEEKMKKDKRIAEIFDITTEKIKKIRKG